MKRGSGGINSRSAKIEGIKIHYLMAGHGPAVILLHGYTQTSRMWKPIMPLLAAKFTVIAPDLPGIGGFGYPGERAGHENVRYSYPCARQVARCRKSEGRRPRYRTDGGLCVRRTVSGGSGKARGDGRFSRRGRMGRRLPTILAFGTFGSNGRTPEALARAGASERTLNTSGTTSRLTKLSRFRKADRRCVRGGLCSIGTHACRLGIFRLHFQQAARDFAELSKTKLTMPVLAIGGEKANGDLLGRQMKVVASDAAMVVLKNAGHWVMEERPKETTDALLKFL